MASARRSVGRPTLVGVILTALTTVLPAGIAEAGAIIPAGYDLFETDPSRTKFTFHDPETAIPANFFGAGSDPFTGVVRFGGEPLETFMGHDVGDADTVVQRMAPANPAPSDTVPIEIVALNLVSVQPITVTYGATNPELWNVSAGLSPTMDSQGSMTITKDPSHPGGTFDTQLRVIPLLTFTRLSDGAVQEFDAAVYLPPQILNMLTLSSENVPWQPGCKLPALSVPELNPSFCPGFTRDGKKVRTIEQAALAQHGVYPAQPQLEHFRCWTLEPKPFDKRQVRLTDQFGTRTAEIARRPELCNPARKNAERYQNKAAHLVCYGTTGKAVDKLVAVRNQFGSQRLLVGKPVRLCLPSRKRLILSQPTTLPRIRVRIDHFQCYAVEAKTGIRTANRVNRVTLKDEFVRERVNLGKPYQICAPVRKNQTLSQHRVRHLVCYRTDGQPLTRRVEIRNQFEQKRLVTVAPRGLCVPSNKVVLTQ